MARNDSNDSSWITTYSGLPFWPLEPRVEDVRILDIAHALSLVCRWSGHVTKFYSVAQHSILVSENVPEKLKLAALLHDASEAYISDLSRPIKRAPGLGEVYMKVEKEIQDSINAKFGIETIHLPEIKRADNLLLLTEQRDLMPENVAFIEDDGHDRLKEIVYPWPSEYAERDFLFRFKEYGGVQ